MDSYGAGIICIVWFLLKGNVLTKIRIFECEYKFFRSKNAHLIVMIFNFISINSRRKIFSLCFL